MKNLKIFKINYRENTINYEITDKIPKFTSNVTTMQFRDIPNFIAKYIVVNKGLSKKYCTIIWKLSYPNQLLDSCKYNLKAIKCSITALYKRLTTKDSTIPEYKYISTTTGEVFKDWKEVSKDIWWHIKHRRLPPVYALNSDNSN